MAYAQLPGSVTCYLKDCFNTDGIIYIKVQHVLYSVLSYFLSVSCMYKCNINSVR